MATTCVRVGCAVAAMWLMATPAAAIPPHVRVTQLVVDSWTTDDGLPQDRVQSIAQTADGLLWVGTESGLARFDGHRFVAAVPPSHAWLRNEAITALLGTPDGSLWVGTGSGQLLRMRQGAITTYTWENGRPGAIWVIADHGREGLRLGASTGLFRVEGHQIRTIDDTTSGVFAITRPRDGVFWFAGRRGLFQDTRGAIRQLGERDGYRWGRVSTLAEAADGALWIGLRSNGVVRYQGGRWTHTTDTTGALGNLVRGLLVDRDQQLWVGTWSGLARFESGAFSRWVNAVGRMPSGIDTLYEDRDGSLWVGSMGGGLYRIRRGAVVAHTADEGLSRDDLMALCVDRTGRTWAGTSDTGADVYIDGKWRRVARDGDLTDSTVWSCTVDSRNRTWLATSGGLFRIEYPRVIRVTLPGSSDEVHSVHATPDAVWTASPDGVYRIDDAGARRVQIGTYRETEGVLGHGVDGTVWFVANEGLVAFRDGTASLVRPNRLETDRPLTMLADADGTLWIGTAGAGLVRIRAGRVAEFGRPSGLPDLTIAGIVDDGRGSLWLTTHSGIVRIERARLDAAPSGARLDPVIYTRRDGLRSHYSDDRGQPTTALGPDGHLWVATTRGAAEIDPDTVSRGPRPTGVFVDEVSVDHRPLAAGSTAPPGRGTLEIRFSTSARISSPHIRFRYRLVPFDPDWVEAGQSRVATYTNVPPGRYQFVVGASDESPDWAPDEAAFAIVLSPHWYQTMWFRAGLALTAAALIAAWPVLRIRRVRRDAAHLTHVVAERTESLRAEVHERRQAEDALRDSEARYRNLVSELDARVRERTRDLEVEIAERARAEVALIRARDDAQAATRAKDAFLATMSHELRTPLNAVIGYSELLIDESGSDAGLEAFTPDLQRIHSAGRHLLALVSDILDFARIEADQVSLSPESFPVHHIVRDVMDSAAALAMRNQNRLHLEAAADLGEMTADPLRLKQILLNLLGNACKFTDHGDITMQVERHEDAGGHSITFAIRDTGIGIAPEHIDKLFVQFSQVDPSARRRHDGAGLGLAISRRLCDLMGGTINVVSTVGVGTVFTVRLPIAPPANSPRSDPA